MNTFNLTLTVNFGPDTLAAVNNFLSLLSTEGAAAPAKSNGVAPMAKQKVTAMPANTATGPTKENGQAAVAEIKVTLEQLREGFAKYKTSKEGKLKCKEILDNLGASSVSSIPEDKYAEALTALNNI